MSNGIDSLIASLKQFGSIKINENMLTRVASIYALLKNMSNVGNITTNINIKGNTKVIDTLLQKGKQLNALSEETAKIDKEILELKKDHNLAEYRMQGLSKAKIDILAKYSKEYQAILGIAKAEEKTLKAKNSLFVEQQNTLNTLKLKELQTEKNINILRTDIKHYKDEEPKIAQASAVLLQRESEQLKIIVESRKTLETSLKEGIRLERELTTEVEKQVLAEEKKKRGISAHDSGVGTTIQTSIARKTGKLSGIAEYEQEEKIIKDIIQLKSVEEELGSNSILIQKRKAELIHAEKDGNSEKVKLLKQELEELRNHANVLESTKKQLDLNLKAKSKVLSKDKQLSDTVAIRNKELKIETKAKEQISLLTEKMKNVAEKNTLAHQKAKNITDDILKRKEVEVEIEREMLNLRKAILLGEEKEEQNANDRIKLLLEEKIHIKTKIAAEKDALKTAIETGQQQKKTFKEIISYYTSTNKLAQRMSFVLTAVASYKAWDMTKQAFSRMATDASIIEEKFSKVFQLIDKSERPLAKNSLTDKTLSMASDYGVVDTDALSKASYDIVSARVELKDYYDVLRNSMIGAEAGFTTIDKSTNTLISTMKALGVEGNNSGIVLDDLFTIIKYGRATMEKLEPNIGRTANAAKRLGVDFKQLGTIISLMSQSVETDVTLTTLRQLMLNLVEPSDEARKIFIKYGLSMDDLNVRTKGLLPVLEKLKVLTDEETVAVASSRRGFEALATALNRSGEFAEIYGHFLNNTGTAIDAFNERAKTTDFVLRQIRANMTELFASNTELNDIYKTSLGGVKLLTDGLVKLKGATGALNAIVLYFSSKTLINLVKNSTRAKNAMNALKVAFTGNTASVGKLGLKMLGQIGIVTALWFALKPFFTSRIELGNFNTNNANEDINATIENLKGLSSNIDLLKENSSLSQIVLSNLAQHGIDPVKDSASDAIDYVETLATAIETLKTKAENFSTLKNIGDNVGELSGFADKLGKQYGVYTNTLEAILGRIGEPARIIKNALAGDVVVLSGFTDRKLSEVDTTLKKFAEASKAIGLIKTKENVELAKNPFMDATGINPIGMSDIMVDENINNIIDVMTKKLTLAYNTEIEYITNSIKKEVTLREKNKAQPGIGLERISTSIWGPDKLQEENPLLLTLADALQSSLIKEKETIEDIIAGGGESVKYTEAKQKFDETKTGLGYAKEGGVKQQLKQMEADIKKYEEEQTNDINQLRLMNKITEKERTSLIEKLTEIIKLKEAIYGVKETEILTKDAERQAKELEDAAKRSVKNAGLTSYGKAVEIQKELKAKISEANDALLNEAINALITEYQDIINSYSAKPETYSSYMTGLEAIPELDLTKKYSKTVSFGQIVDSFKSKKPDEIGELQTERNKNVGAYNLFDEQMMGIRNLSGQSEDDLLQTNEEYLKLYNERAKAIDAINELDKKSNAKQQQLADETAKKWKTTLNMSVNYAMQIYSQYYSYRIAQEDYLLQKNLKNIETELEARKEVIGKTAITEKQKTMLIARAEKKAEKEREALQKEANKKKAEYQYKMAMANLIMSFAQAQMQLFASPGYPMAWLLQPFLLGVYAQQLKAIEQAKKISSAGFSDGGYTGDGERYDVAGVVHKKEVVFEKPIVDGQVNDIMAIRGLLQKGVSAKQLLSGFSFDKNIPLTSARYIGYDKGGYSGEKSINLLTEKEVESAMSKALNKINVVSFNEVNDRQIYIASVRGKRSSGEF